MKYNDAGSKNMKNQETEQDDKNKLRRDIGPVAAGFLVLNGVIGAGIFGLPGKLAEQAGIFSPLIILISGLLVITIVWTFAAISSYFNGTGGPVAYASRAFGPAIGFQIGWLLYVGRVASLAANVNVLLNYVIYLLDGPLNNITRGIIILVFILTLVIINIMGVKRAIHAINLLTLLKSIPILVLILIGLPYISPEGLLPGDFPQIEEPGTLILLILYAFLGFEGALVTAGETKNPKKNLPRALITTIIAITIIYFLIQLVYVNVVIGGSNVTPLIGLGRELMGPVGGMVMILTAIFSITGNATSIVIAAPRMTFSMAESGSLPKWFSHINERYNTPINSILFLGGFAVLLGVTGTFIYLAAASALARVVAIGICMLSLPSIKRQADQETIEGATKLPYGHLIPATAFVVCVAASVLSPLSAWKYFSLFVVFGTVLYLVNNYFKEKV